MKAFLCLALLLLSPTLAVAAPRPFLDLDFEAAECSNGWWRAGRGATSPSRLLR